MKKILFILLVLISSVSLADERIISFNSDIVVHEDASITVTETIIVNAEGKQIKRGIFRDFPTEYKNEKGEIKRVGFKVLDVLRDGRKEPYHVQRINDGKRIYIGKEGRFISHGEHVYTIIYETNRQIRYFNDYDEIYWNVTGNGWKFPIDKATARIKLPDGAEILNSHGYTGYAGKNGQDYKIKGLSFETTRNLAKGEGLTIAVAFPKGVVEQPDESDFFLEDNLGLVLNIGILAFLLGYYYWAWNKVGRDPKKGTIIPRFKPPADFSPAQVRELLKMNVDKKCFTAAIINMAVNGVIKIREAETVGLLGSKEFVLDKISDDTTHLAPEEKEAFDILFKDSNSIELNQKRFRLMRKVLDAFHVAITEDKKEMFTTNGGYIIIGVLITIISFFAGVVISIEVAAKPSAPQMFALFITFLLNPIFAYLLKAPSETGRKMMDEIEGFKMFLKTTEKHRFDALHPPEKTPELFEKYLPYAIALGVENQWGEQFEDVLANALAKDGNKYHPSWYIGGSLGAFSSASFANNISSTLSSAVSTSTATSGSGGGGSSGGGGGGGGGGGW